MKQMVVPAECTRGIWQQALRLQVQVQVQVLQTCTGVQLEYKYVYQVLHGCCQGMWNTLLFTLTLTTEVVVQYFERPDAFRGANYPRNQRTRSFVHSRTDPRVSSYVGTEIISTRIRLVKNL